MSNETPREPAGAEPVEVTAATMAKPAAPAPAKHGTTMLEAGRVLGRCRIERELGRGGMGAVYLAQHTTLDIPVAVKILPAEIAARDPHFAERFMREAKLACRIKHPNVIAVMDAERDEKSGLYYIVQEYVDGGNVRDLMRKGTLTEAQALDIAIGVAEALAAAAEFGIVHRDIKPENIMLTKKGVVKLADLGIAKERGGGSGEGGSDTGLTMTQVMMGTPAYMAPEQAHDAKNVDARADIYSLGATLYHMLCGAPPFSGNTTYSVLIKLATEPTPDPHAKRPDLSDGVVKLIMRMMEKEKKNRPQSAAELLAELKALRTTNAASGDLQKMAMEIIGEVRKIQTATSVGRAEPQPIMAKLMGDVGSGKRLLVVAVAGLAVLSVFALGVLAVLRQRGETAPPPKVAAAAASAASVSAPAAAVTPAVPAVEAPDEKPAPLPPEPEKPSLAAALRPPPEPEPAPVTAAPPKPVEPAPVTPAPAVVAPAPAPVTAVVTPTAAAPASGAVVLQTTEKPGAAPAPAVVIQAPSTTPPPVFGTAVQPAPVAVTPAPAPAPKPVAPAPVVIASRPPIAPSVPTVRRRPLTPAVIAAGRECYTRVGMWADKSSIMGTNYHYGSLIPAGTRVVIHDVGRREVSFTVAGTKTTYVLENVEKYTKIGMDDLAKRTFCAEDPWAADGYFTGFSQQVQACIREGRLEPGMSREAVIAAYGYPPAHRTPSLTADEWVYWKTRSGNFPVNFNNGVVNSVTEPAERRR